MEGISMRDFRNELAALKTENFSLKLRIYQMEKREQQTSDDSTEDNLQTVVGQDLFRRKETELFQLQNKFQAKVLEVQSLQRALDEKEQQLSEMQEDKEQLEEELEDLQQQRMRDSEAVKAFTLQMKTLQDNTKDVENMTATLLTQLETRPRDVTEMGQKLKGVEAMLAKAKISWTSEVSRLESSNKQLSKELILLKKSNENLIKALEDTQNQNKTLCGKREEKEIKLAKTIQGLLELVDEKDKEIAKLHYELEVREKAFMDVMTDDIVKDEFIKEMLEQCGQMDKIQKKLEDVRRGLRSTD